MSKELKIKEKIKFPKEISNKKIENFFIDKGLKEMVFLGKNQRDKKVNEKILVPYKPELDCLYRLWQFIVLNKRTTILEFGSGWSSLIFSLALSELKLKYKNQIKKLRRNNPFELFILEDQKKYLNITKKRILKNKNKITIRNHYFHSNVYMTTFNDRISTSYEKLPLCSPDFIYLDGPDTNKVKGSVDGFSTKHKDLMPMVNDILKIEYFLTPGTIIIVDGRASNTKFMLDNFKRKWLYKKISSLYDQHVLYLDDPSLGKYNDLQLKFYKKNI